MYVPSHGGAEIETLLLLLLLRQQWKRIIVGRMDGRHNKRVLAKRSWGDLVSSAVSGQWSPRMEEQLGEAMIVDRRRESRQVATTQPTNDPPDQALQDDRRALIFLSLVPERSREEESWMGAGRDSTAPHAEQY
jgi:hypothetical protein